ncbi:MAG: ABC-type transport auxiliary lipoprotein family protein [Candidatus Hydrogenedentes bacterium]|jgi:uncharacterized lipoprotein YmbA|nr:ABC-type transport auxiliary lipoprotein family protein [Candidatus Hydrogenedentota bacterium]
MTNSYRAVIAAVVLAGMAFGGCASAPDLNYYTLDMRASGAEPPPANIEIDRIQVAESLSRTDILIRTSATEVEYYATDRWVSNIGALVREKLQSEFGSPLTGRKTVSLSGEIFGFGQVDTADGAEAHVKISVIVSTADARRSESPLVEKTYEVSARAASATPGAVVEALSKGLESVAASIAADIAAAR